MSRLEVPLQHRTLRATGDTVLWADLVLSLKTNRGAWKEIPFRVDSGTEMTTMPAFEARTLDLPIPKNPVSRLVLHGQEVRSGLLRARIVGMDPTEFVFSPPPRCHVGCGARTGVGVELPAEGTAEDRRSRRRACLR